MLHVLCVHICKLYSIYIKSSCKIYFYCVTHDMPLLLSASRQFLQKFMEKHVGDVERETANCNITTSLIVSITKTRQMSPKKTRRQKNKSAWIYLFFVSFFRSSRTKKISRASYKKNIYHLGKIHFSFKKAWSNRDNFLEQFLVPRFLSFRLNQKRNNKKISRKEAKEMKKVRNLLFSFFTFFCVRHKKKS